MHTRKRHLRRWIAVAFVAAAVTAPVAQATSPDDRALYRGTDPALAPKSQSPDDRPFARPFASEPRTGPVAVVNPPSGFDWGDAAIGGAFGLALALLGAGAILIAQHRRSTLGTA